MLLWYKNKVFQTQYFVVLKPRLSYINRFWITLLNTNQSKRHDSIRKFESSITVLDKNEWIRVRYYDPETKLITIWSDNTTKAVFYKKKLKTKSYRFLVSWNDI